MKLTLELNAEDELNLKRAFCKKDRDCRPGGSKLNRFAKYLLSAAALSYANTPERKVPWPVAFDARNETAEERITRVLCRGLAASENEHISEKSI